LGSRLKAGNSTGESVRVALCQMNSTVGDLGGNYEKLLAGYEGAVRQGADIVVFPELFLSGYPPEDLLFRKEFLSECLHWLRKFSRKVTTGVAIVGAPLAGGKALYNAAAVIAGKRILSTYRKVFLPNYGVFDERRYFESGNSVPSFALGRVKFGITICEDIWFENGPAACVARQAGVDLIVNLSSSPYYHGKLRERSRILKERALETGSFVCYANLVGGQDELVFDGGSLVLDPRGRVLAKARQFEEQTLIADLPHAGTAGRRRRVSKHEFPWSSSEVRIPTRPAAGGKPPVEPAKAPRLGKWEEIYEALKLGTRDYVRKNGFEKVTVGLSGGIDSALTVTVAADALGRDSVVAVSMPSRYSSEGTRRDTVEQARLLGVELLEIPIDGIYAAFLSALAESIGPSGGGITEENIQARIRGTILMALSNRFGWLVLTTGNKSETSVGYCTLYGDTAGGFAVIKDVPKTWVYELARYRNSKGPEPVIPETVIQRAPSAELKPDQRDEDTLPPYDLLDRILELYVSKEMPVRRIISRGFPPEVVREVARMVDRSEYKRRQAPPGVRITPRAFGKDRRMPITDRFRPYGG